MAVVMPVVNFNPFDVHAIHSVHANVNMRSVDFGAFCQERTGFSTVPHDTARRQGCRFLLVFAKNDLDCHADL
jgi:hypothetical protein